VISPLKTALEDLLRARRLYHQGPALRGEDRRSHRLPCGIAELDARLAGGLPRGQVSEIHGPASSGRTGLALSFGARVTRQGLLAWVDPGDRLDPGSAQRAGLDLKRLLWLRGAPRPRDGGALASTLAATGTLLSSGLFEAVVLDLAGLTAAEVARWPASSWIRLQRLIEEQPLGLLLLSEDHVPHAPNGVSLRLLPGRGRWSGPAGPARLLRGLTGQVHLAHRLSAPLCFELLASA
jgi:hypothetical protein